MESIALIKTDFVKLCNRDIETSGVQPITISFPPLLCKDSITSPLPTLA